MTPEQQAEYDRYIPYAEAMSRRYARITGEPIDEYRQIAHLALIEACLAGHKQVWSIRHAFRKYQECGQVRKRNTSRRQREHPTRSGWLAYDNALLTRVAMEEATSVSTPEGGPDPLEELKRIRVKTELSVTEEYVIKYTYGLDGAPELTGPEIAEKLGVSRQMINLIKIKALGKLAATANQGEA
jgi:hypothetical protein